MSIKPIEVEFLMRDKLTPGIDKAGTAADSLADKASGAAKSITARISEQRAEIKRVEHDLRALEKQYKRMSPGREQMEMRAEINACSKALHEERVNLKALEDEHKRNVSSSGKLTTELRQLQNALAQMRIEGQAGTAAYKEMSQRAALLSDTIGDLRTQTNILAHDNAGLQGVMSGVNALSGAFTVATGVMGVFAREHEDLVKIQTRVQSVMAVTMGLQQVMNTLNRDSAFRLVTLRKAKELLTAANHKLAVSLGISNTAAKALMGTLTLGLSVAVTAAIVAYDKYTDARKKAREEGEKQVEIERSARAEAIKTGAAIQHALRQIKEFQGSKNQEINLVKDLNDKYGDVFGTYSTLSDWYDVLSKKGMQYVNVLFLQAKAQSLINKAVEADEKAAGISAAPESDYDTWWGYGGKIDRFFSGDKDYKKNNNGKWLKEKARSEAEQVKQAYLDEAERLQQEAAEIMRNFDLGGHYKETPPIPPTQNNEKDLSEYQEKALRRIEDNKIAIMKEGYEKKRAEADFEYRKELERIDKEEKERIALYERLRKAGIKIKPQEKMKINVQAFAQRAGAALLHDNRIREINDKEMVARKKAIDDLLIKYGDFSRRRLIIEENYNKDLKALQEQRTEHNTAEIDAAIIALKAKKKSELLEVDEAESEKIDKQNKLIVSLFADSADKTISEIKKIIRESQSLFDYLIDTPSVDISQKFGLSAAKLRTLKESPEALEAIRRAIDKLKKEVSGRSPIDRFIADMNTAIKDIDKGGSENLGKGITRIGQAVDSVLPSVSELGKLFGEALGDSSLVDSIESAVGALSEMSHVASGIGRVISGDIIGGLQNVAKGLLGLLSMRTQAEKRHREALRQVEAARIAYQREYNLLLLRQNLLFKEGETVFGERQIQKAANAVKVYHEAVRQLKEAMRGSAPVASWITRTTGLYRKQLDAYNKGIGALYNARIVTGHRKTGLFGWGKGKDVYTSILDVYPKLIKANGDLDTEMLKVILSTRKMDDATRSNLQGLLEYQKVMDEAAQALDAYLKETFGALGGAMTKSIVTAIRDGGDALQLFSKDVAKVFENLGEQLSYSLFFAEAFERLQKQLKAIYSSGKSETDIAEEAAGIISGFFNGIGGQVDEAKKWMEDWKRKAKDKGFDLWSAEISQSGRPGAFTAMSQEQGTKLEGMFTAAEIHWANIDDNVQSVTETLSLVLDGVARIVNNTSAIASIYSEILVIKRDGIKIK